MQYYSTSHRSHKASLREAIMHSEAPDGGLYMPEAIRRLPKAVFNNIAEMSAIEIAYLVANTLFGDDIPSATIKEIAQDSLNFPIPLVEVEPGIYALEVFHGPTMNVKDVACRFTARMIKSASRSASKPLNVLVSTNGNSGCAVANGFRDLPGVNVFAMYPKGTPQHLVAQLAGPGGNVHPICVNGTIDDCRAMLNAALSDQQLNEDMLFTCANSVNIARVLPSAICYFIAYAQLMAKNYKPGKIVMSVPCGNSGGLLAGYISMMMGLPIDKLIAACNANAAFAHYLNGADPTSFTNFTEHTLAYAMDSCRPTNIPRFEALCNGDRSKLRQKITSGVCTDDEIRAVIADVYNRCGYIMGPHSAVGYKCLKDNLPAGASGIFMATAHPARSAKVVNEIIGKDVAKLQHKYDCCNRSRGPEQMIAPTYPALKKHILQILAHQA